MRIRRADGSPLTYTDFIASQVGIMLTGLCEDIDEYSTQALGSPPDFDLDSMTTRFNMWFGEHSYSHLSLRELLTLPDYATLADVMEQFTTECTMRLLGDHNRHTGRTLDDYRIVFGFDS